MSDDDTTYTPREPGQDPAVFEHRLERLLTAGYPLETAEAIAASHADLHRAVLIASQGCPPGLAERILT